MRYPKPLIEGAVAGNQDDFVKLLEWCMRDIIYFASLHVNRQDAEDVAQEVAIILQQKIHTLSKLDNFRQWLITIVRNTSVSYMRKHYKYQNNVEIEEFMEQEKYSDKFSAEGVEFLPEKYVEDMEFCAIVKEEIDKLPKNQQICLSYHYLQDFKRAEIASLTDLTPMQVSTALHYGSKTLKQKIEKRLRGALVFSVTPAGMIPALARVFEIRQAEVVPTQWCEQVLQTSLERLGTMSASGMSGVTKLFVCVATCVAVTTGVLGTVALLRDDAPSPESVSSSVIVNQEEPEDDPVYEEPTYEEWVIRTVADMIGETEANVLEGFVDHVDSQEAWHEFVERIDAKEYERANEYRETFVTYILEKQNKRLLLAKHEAGDGGIEVMYLFEDREEPIATMAVILILFDR